MNFGVLSVSDKEDFISKTFGDEVLNKIKNIHRGGHNANKGQAYEEQFVLSKVLELASSKYGSWSFHIISRQNLDFFDDICHFDQSENIKYNYQAKNSSLGSANWNHEHSERARYQIEIDFDYHKVRSSKNYLVVPDKEKQMNNLDLIPDDLKKYCDSIYFPYSSDKLDKQYFEPHLSKMTKSSYPDDQDYALNVLRGALSNNITPSSIKDIFRRMESQTYPNPFINEESIELPAFVGVHLDRIGLPYKYDGNNLIIQMLLEIRVPRRALGYIDQNKFQKLGTKQEICSYLMTISSEALKGN